MRTATYRLERAQLIPREREQIFAFFAEAANLERLTPDFLNFRILTLLPIDLQPGTLIDYRLKLYGFPFTWCTRIETFDPPQSFTDIQLQGPYRRWHHLHEFFAVAGGTLVVDRVLYELPFGILGTLAHGLFVRRMLDHIFDYRRECLQALFPPRETSAHDPHRTLHTPPIPPCGAQR
jgi:ligand-binding SRPBCC domain-containing protein